MLLVLVMGAWLAAVTRGFVWRARAEKMAFARELETDTVIRKLAWDAAVRFCNIASYKDRRNLLKGIAFISPVLKEQMLDHVHRR